MSIGKKLKTAREKKKITLRQAYERTRIHPDVLRALEQDEHDKILNPTYIRSFLKGYASYLGLDVSKIIEEYNKLKPQKPKYHRPVPPSRTPQKLQKLGIVIRWLSKNAPSVLKWVVILVVVVIALKGTFKITRYIKDRAKAKQAEQTKQAKQTKQTRQSKQSKFVIPKGEKLMLVIDATDDAWLRLKVDGKIIFENILKKGSSETWEAKDNFTIWTGKAHALLLDLNGNYLGAAGKGVVKNLVIDRKGIKR